MNWKTILRWTMPMLRMAGEDKKNEDSNSTGKDDAQGIAMVFAADLVEAIVLNKPLPKAPDVLR